MKRETSSKMRAVNVSILNDSSNTQRAESVLRSLPGARVNSKTGGGKINVTYDVTQLTYGDLIKVLKDQRLVEEMGWWQRIKAFWLNYQDINMRDNLTAPPSPCCSNPAQITGSGKKR